MTGMVNKVIMLLSAVRDTESATSPLASIEKTLEELPPGEQAIIIIPMKNTGSTSNIKQMIKAMSGRNNICPTIPAMTGFGRVRKALKSSRFIVNPNSNINRVSMGSTIQTVFIIRIKKTLQIYGHYPNYRRITLGICYSAPRPVCQLPVPPASKPYMPYFPGRPHRCFSGKNLWLSDKFFDV